MPSQSLEGFGLTLVESLACGTPALCTPVGGMPEILTRFSPDLINSFSCEATAIAQRLEELPWGRYFQFSRAACQDYAATNFDWHKIAFQSLPDFVNIKGQFLFCKVFIKYLKIGTI